MQNPYDNEQRRRIKSTYIEQGESRTQVKRAKTIEMMGRKISAWPQHEAIYQKGGGELDKWWLKWTHKQRPVKECKDKKLESAQTSHLSVEVTTTAE